MLKFRHGISPVAKNIRNIRYKVKPTFDIDKVNRVEGILKDLIDYSFADHVQEQILSFDEEGQLMKIEEGNVAGKASKDKSQTFRTNMSPSQSKSAISEANSIVTSVLSDDSSLLDDGDVSQEFTSVLNGNKT